MQLKRCRKSLRLKREVHTLRCLTRLVGSRLHSSFSPTAAAQIAFGFVIAMNASVSLVHLRCQQKLGRGKNFVFNAHVRRFICSIFSLVAITIPEFFPNKINLPYGILFSFIGCLIQRVCQSRRRGQTSGYYGPTH